jgi:3-oxoacyl-[acyl-carrier protein] reductase
MQDAGKESSAESPKSAVVDTYSSPLESVGGKGPRVAIVTGAGRGIGRATALALAASGTSVVVAYLRNREAADAAVEDVRSLGADAFAYRADVTQEEETASLVERTLERFGTVDILVNNAGVADRANILELSLQEWTRIIAANLTTAFLCTRAVLPTMMDRKYGRIVNVSSLAGKTGGVNGPHYAAAKGGLIALTRHLGRQLAPHGITVNAVAPNFTETDLIAQLGLAEERGRLAAGMPMGRLARPEEVAAVIAFLCSEGASYVSGECVTIAGGL